MWTIEAREALLNGINEKLKDGSTLSFFVNDEHLFDLAMLPPKIESGALIFEETEVVSTGSGNPTRAVLSADNVNLLELSIPDDLQLVPAEVINGSTITLKRFAIQ